MRAGRLIRDHALDKKLDRGTVRPDTVVVVVGMLESVPEGDARYPLVRNAALSVYGESVVHRAESRLVRKRAEEYGRLCDEARRLGIPTSLDDPATPKTVADLRAAVAKKKETT